MSWAVKPVHGSLRDVSKRGYGKLHVHFEKRAIDDMKHAEKRIGRILFPEGVPHSPQPAGVHIGVPPPGRRPGRRLFEGGCLRTQAGSQSTRPRLRR